MRFKNFDDSYKFEDRERIYDFDIQSKCTLPPEVSNNMFLLYTNRKKYMKKLDQKLV